MLHQNCQKRSPTMSVEASARLNALDFGAGQSETFGQMDYVRCLASSEKAELFGTEGAGCIRSLVLTCAEGIDLRDLCLALCVDGADAPQVQGTAADFFLSGWDGRENMGEYAGKNCSLDGKTTLYRLIDIPYRAGCLITVENASANEMAEIELVITYQRQKTPICLGEKALLRSAKRLGRARNWNETITLMDVKGSGMLDSIQFSMRNALTRGQFMEGNFEIYLDGNVFPEYQSTGTEEFFMGGIYFTNLHESAYSGCTRTFNDGGMNPDNVISAHRIFKEDPITWKHSIRIVWHNGQSGQGTVLGPTEYDFFALYYTQTSMDVAAQTVTADEADRRLSALDGGNAAVRPLLSCRSGMEVQARLTWAEPGALELLALQFQKPLNACEAEHVTLSITIDGCRQDDVPLSLLTMCDSESPLSVTGNGGCTAEDSYHRRLHISFRHSLEIVCRCDVPLQMYAEWRAGQEPYGAGTRLICREFTNQGWNPYPIAEGRGWVEAICLQTKSGLYEGTVEWGSATHKPLGVVPMRTFFLCPGRVPVTKKICDAAGFMVREDHGALAYRTFPYKSFRFEDGLEMRIAQTEPVRALVILHEDRPYNVAHETVAPLLARLNVLDGAANAYEGRCYNPIEDCGHDPVRIKAGETKAMFEDFGPGMITGIRLGSPWTGEALHEAQMRIWVDDNLEPAVQTTCARFFSADYEDPLFWSHTRSLLRPSKRGWENERNKGTHTSFMRYFNMPYRKYLRFEMDAPSDSEIGGFDNVYWASARSSPADFGPYERLRGVEGEAQIKAGGRIRLIGTQGPGLLTSLQMMMNGENASMRTCLLELCDGEKTLISAPVWQFFLGTPGTAPCLNADYLAPWKETVEAQEGYYSAPESGWIRRGKECPCRDVMYRLMEKRPFVFSHGLNVWLTHNGSGSLHVQADGLIRSGY